MILEAEGKICHIPALRVILFSCMGLLQELAVLALKKVSAHFFMGVSIPDPFFPILEFEIVAKHLVLERLLLDQSL